MKICLYFCTEFRRIPIGHWSYLILHKDIDLGSPKSHLIGTRSSTGLPPIKFRESSPQRYWDSVGHILNQISSSRARKSELIPGRRFTVTSEWVNSVPISTCFSTTAKMVGCRLTETFRIFVPVKRLFEAIKVLLNKGCFTRALSRDTQYVCVSTAGTSPGA